MNKRLWTFVLGVTASAGLACGLMPRDIAKNCEKAIENLGQPDEMMLNDCVRYYSTVATEEELVTLDCMAAANSQRDWDECRRAEHILVEVAIDEGEGPGVDREFRGNEIELALGTDEEARAEALEIAKDAGILQMLGSLDSEGDGYIGAEGFFGGEDLNAFFGGEDLVGMEALGGRTTQFGSGGLGSRGSGIGGGGTAEGLGGLGTKGYSGGASAHGLGAKGDAPKTVVGKPQIVGALDKETIDQVIKRHVNQIRYCYERELNKDPSLQGQVVIDFTIAADGSVSESKVKSDTLSNSAVGECVNGRFWRMQFPQPRGGGVVRVSYPLILNSE
jgi:hypothetical protein